MATGMNDSPFVPMSTATANIRSVFDALPGNHLLLLPDDPHFSILAFSRSIAEKLLPGKIDAGKSIFEQPGIEGETERLLRQGLEMLVSSKKAQIFLLKAFDKRGTSAHAGPFQCTLKPVSGEGQQVAAIICTLEEAGAKDMEDGKGLIPGNNFQHFFDQAHAPFSIIKGKDMVFSFANPAYRQLMNGRELVGKTLYEAIPELRGQPFANLLEEVFRTGKPFHVNEIPATAVFEGGKEPSTRYFNLSYTPYKNERGETEGILASGYDVTEQVMLRKIAEKDKLNGDAYRLFLQAPLGICILEGEAFMIELANDAFLEITGKSRLSFVGRPLWEALPEVRTQGYDELLREVKRTGVAYRGSESEVELMRFGKKETLWVNYVFEPLMEEDRSVNRIMVLAIDVTEQVEARHKIEYAEERARLAIESAGLGVYEVSLVTDEMITSPRMNAIFGFDRTLSRAEYVSVIHPDDLEIRDKAHQEALTRGKLEYEARINWKDGSLHWIRVNGRVLFDAKGRPQRMLGMVQDITEQKQFAGELARQVKERTQELEEKNSELQQFANVTSHDLQEPLRKVMIFTEMIQARDFDKLGDLSKQQFSKIREAVSRLSESLKDLLNFTSLRKEEQFSLVNLNEVLRHVLADLEIVISHKDAVIEAPDLPIIRAIPLQMHQLFYNLLNNALKFSREGVRPFIQLSVKRKTRPDSRYLPELDTGKEYLEIVVSDNGIGFDQEHASRIFQMFQRLHTKQAYTGTGIGLALCKKIALNHAGDIYALSEPGRGASFYIYLSEYPTGSTPEA
ncbi:MAG TPA: PAS domain-containing protein [Flavisolibacter sp.]|nr:PAS domain-containing protein [Flavisolibacter sp.]